MKTGAAYPEYKSSGVPWLRKIPAHWQVKRLKFLAPLVYGDSLAGSGRVDGHVPVFGSNGQVGTHTHSNTLAPALVIGRKGSYGKVNYSTEQCFAIDTTYFIDSRCTKEHLRWVFFALPLLGLDTASQDCGVPGLSREFAHDQWVATPPRGEQQVIAEFLDRETGKLDGLVQKKERLIAMLQEKRTSIISHAVTKGLNPAAPMKDSGVAWLGKVPRQWEVGRLKFRLKMIEQGWSPQCDNQPAQPGQWGVLKAGCMNSTVYDESENKALPSGVEPAPEYEVKVGDVLISRSNTVELVGAAGIVHQTQGKILLCDKLFRLVFDPKKLSREYATRLLRSPAARRQIEAASSGASPSMKNISNGAIANLVLPFPPLAEQQAIMQWTDAEALKLDALIAKVRTGIERLQEYRTALISAAVTGKIDVRQAQPSARGPGQPTKVKK